MTVYLTRTFFKPAWIVLSILFGFFFLFFGILTIAFFDVLLLAMTLIVVAAYGVLVGLAYWFSKSKKYYLQEEQQGLHVRFPKINFDKGEIRIPYGALVGFDFFPLRSKNTWLNFIAYAVVPECVYVTYVNRYGQRVTELMGYITQSDAEALAQRYNIKFTLN